MELLAPLPELDRLVDGDVAALEPADDLLELAAELLERRLVACSTLAHGRTSVDGGAEARPLRARSRAGCPGATRAGVSQGRAAGAHDRVAARQGRARRERLQAGGRVVERDAGAARAGAAALRAAGSPSRSRRSRSRASARRTEPSSRPRSRVQPGLQLGEIGHDEARRGRRRRGAHVGGEVAERRVLLVPDGGDDGHRAARRTHGRRASSLNGSRSSKLPPPRATMTTSTAGWAATRRERRGDPAAGARALDAGLGDDDVGGRKPRADARDDVAAGGRVRARDDADGAREARQRALALGREQALGGEDALEPLDRGEVVAEPDPLDRARPEAELALRLVDLGLALDEHALTVGELELELVEPAPLHRGPQQSLRSPDP